jgi:hypothetical protein
LSANKRFKVAKSFITFAKIIAMSAGLSQNNLFAFALFSKCFKINITYAIYLNASFNLTKISYSILILEIMDSLLNVQESIVNVFAYNATT